MSEINGTSNSYPINTSSTTYGVSTSKAVNENGIMGKDDFLKLFLASLQHQDPLAPMETKDMMEQMSQLSLIEQITNMGNVVDQLKEAIQPDGNSVIEQGVNFIGKEISGTDKAGKEVKGVVDEVVIDKGIVSLLVNNEKVEISALSRIADYSMYGGKTESTV